MPELIDRNELRRRIYERFGQYSTKVIATVEEGKIIEDWAFLEPFLNAAPSIEAEPVRHGWWEKNESKQFYIYPYKCSVCKEINEYPFPYCPICGARMDGGSENG